MILPNKVYDSLKWIAQYLLPGLATLYFVLSNVWGFPETERIVGTIVALNVFLGAILGISNLEYNRAKNKMSQLPLFDGAPSYPFGMSPRNYEVLKWGTLIFLPSSGALYLAVASLWGLAYSEQVVGTIAGITTFLGGVLGFSKSYAKRQK